MKRIAISILTATTFVTAGTCTYKAVGTPHIVWKAYKTPLKLGVGGTFKQIDFTVSEGKKALDSLLKSMHVRIDVKSVDSGNAGRDEKLRRDFFARMKGDGITARIVDVLPDLKENDEGVLKLEVTMNGRTVPVMMRYEIEENRLEAEGYVDILDFSANEALRSINKACFDLHQGKTWSDVAIGFEVSLDGDCDD
jgi:polyisoprenoid-binding protein YceI